MPAGYDLVIASPDGSRATVYQGLTRRDPAVGHDGARPGGPAYKAEISVTLSGSAAAEMVADRWQVHFVSPDAFAAIPGKGGWSAAGGKLVNGTPDLSGKVAAVTGASSGIGEATALALAGAGASVSLAARRADRIDALVKRITDAGGKGFVKGHVHSSRR